MSMKPTSVPDKVLQNSITSSASSFQLADILSWAGTDLTSADFGSQAFVVFRNATSTQLEIMEIDPTTIASSSITILRRGLAFTGDLTTESSSRKLSWVRGTQVSLGTHTPQLYQFLKEYIDAAAIAGGVPATTTVLGLNKMSVAPASAPSPIAVGDNDPRIAPNNYAASAVGTDAYAINPSSAVTAYAAGQVYSFKADVANTGAATLNVSSLGAKTIKKNVSSDLDTGDIPVGQIVSVIYDGTNFQLVSRAGSSGVQVYTSNNTWTKPLNCQAVEVVLIGGGGGGGSGGSDTDYNGSGSTGGGGGGGGGFSRAVFPGSILTSTVAITIGSGGAGGASVGSPGVGIVGTAGGDSSFGAFLIAKGGGAGGAGQINGGAGGTAGSAGKGTSPAVSSGTAGGAGGGCGATGGAGVASELYVPTGGGGGGGNQNASGGAGGAMSVGIVRSGGTANSGVGVSATAGEATGGTGGGGGIGSTSGGTGGDGGAGGTYGGGGGGGGAVTPGGSSGNGGAGAAGIVMVISW